MPRWITPEGDYFKFPAIVALKEDGKATIIVLFKARTQSVPHGALCIIQSKSVTITKEIIYIVITLFVKSYQ